MNLQSVTNQLLFSTVRLVSSAANRKSISTGFIVNYEKDGQIVPLLLTTAHSVNGMELFELQFFRTTPEGEPSLGTTETVTVQIPNPLLTIDESLDICVLALGPVFSHFAQNGKGLFFRALPTNIFATTEEMAEFNAIESVIFVGYPRGIWDAYNKLPLFRTGITSTPLWANYENKSWFVIDSEVFPGSSGSPVFLFNEGSYQTKGGLVLGTRIKFVGMILQSFNDAQLQHLGLGIALNAPAVRSFIDTAVERFLKVAVSDPGEAVNRPSV